MNNIPVKRLRRFLAFTLSGLLLMTFLVVGTSKPAVAADARNFVPGNIISDTNFYNGSDMSVAEIQRFLNQRVSRCTLGDPGREKGKPTVWNGPTFLAQNCLKDAKFNTRTHAADAYCAAYRGKNGESAAEIIAKVAQSCNISPRVILITLEKEQSLVTDDWPTVKMFDIAMGFACPDTGVNNSANCDSTYFGFHNQVYWGARQFQVYKANPGRYNYRPGTNTVLWHPNQSCGTSRVNITNWATASLYIYTPYRPNQAALNAQWGTGNSCSSYGNRNFFMLYSSWFGSPIHTIHSKFQTYATSHSTTLGNVISDPIEAKGAVQQKFEKGILTWHSSTGVVLTKGGIGDFYLEKDGLSGRLGYPLSSERRVAGGYIQDFSGGLISYISRTASYPVQGSIFNTLSQIGGISTTGLALGAEKLIQGTWRQEFENGTIVSKSGVGGFWLTGPILEVYEENSHILGTPTSMLKQLNDGFSQEFENATVVYRENGVFYVRGSIRNFVSQIGGLETVGVPLAAEQQQTSGVWTQEFSQGTVVWQYPYGAFSGDDLLSSNLIRSGLKGLGTQQLTENHARGFIHVFENATLYSTLDYELLPVQGSIRKYQSQIGGVEKTGFPLSKEHLQLNGVWVQEFENGTIAWQFPNGAFLENSPMAEDILKSGLTRFGTQVSGLTIRDDGYTQEFSEAQLFWTPSLGLQVVRGGILNYHKKIGGFEKTGAPIGAEYLQTSGVWAQEFENGTLEWQYPNGNFVARQ